MISEDLGYMAYVVGKPMPRIVPVGVGSMLHMEADGSLVCLLQLPGLSRNERKAFQASFRTYGYLETGTTPPVAFWIWNWPAPLCPADVSFDAVVADQYGVRLYLEKADGGGVKNMILFLLLDGQILRGMRYIGLEPDAVRAFHKTIRKQLELNRPPAEFKAAIAAMYNYSNDELYAMSIKFTK